MMRCVPSSISDSELERRLTRMQRVAPMLASPVVQDAYNKTIQINSALGARASATIQSSQELSHALLEQLRTLAAQGTEIPGVMLDVGSYSILSPGRKLNDFHAESRQSYR